MPSPASLYVDPSLSEISSKRARNNWVAMGAFPPVLVPKQQGLYFNGAPSSEQLIPLQVDRAAAGEPYKYDNEDPNTTAYDSVDHALVGYLSDEEVANADDAARAEITKVEDIEDALSLVREIALVTLLNTLSQTGVPTTRWDVVANGDMIRDVKAEKETIAASVGVQPNAIVVTQQILDEASETTAWKDRAQFTMTPDEQRALGQTGLLAAMIDIPRANVFVGESWKNTAIRGQTAVITRVWSDDCLLFFREEPRQQSQGLGHHLTWTGGAGASNGFLVERDRVVLRKAEMFVLHNYWDQILMNSGAGFLFTSVLT